MDVIKPAAKADFDERMTQEIAQAIQVLHSLQGWTNQDAFAQFKADFLERYGEREVPLLEALDDEAGIGFERDDDSMVEPLLAGLSFDPLHETEPLSEEEGPLHSLLARRVDEVRASREVVLELDKQLLQELRVADPPPLPDALAAMGVLFPGSRGESGFFLQSVSGPSGANLLARFCHADPRLAECVQAHLRAEEALAPEGTILAEIAHLPEAQVGNIASRPVLRHFEIPYFATSTLPPDRQIQLSVTIEITDRERSRARSGVGKHVGRLKCAIALAEKDRNGAVFLAQHQQVELAVAVEIGGGQAKGVLEIQGGILRRLKTAVAVADQDGGKRWAVGIQ
jgi:hypothetical protein